MKKQALVLLIGLIGIAVFQFLVLQNKSQDLRVFFLDVGQGDAELIVYPTGETLLIDTGKDFSIFRQLDLVLPWYSKRVDYMLLTHGDLDHVGAAVEILSRYKVKKLFVSPFFGQIEIEKQIAAKAAERNTQIEVLDIGDIITFGTERPNSFKIIHPDTSCFSVYNNENECSLVGLLTYGTTTFLFTGDTGQPTETIYDDFVEKPIDVLKVGHHGSRESTSAEFLAKVKPRYSVIEAGKDNSYGHPHKETIERLAQASTTIFDTKEDATIVASSNGETVEIKGLFDQTSLLESSVCAILLYGFDSSC